MKRFALMLLITLGAVLPVMAQDRPILADITGEGVCKASNPDQKSKKADVKLLQSSSGFRLLEVETEEFIARGPAAQSQSKKTGRVAYFLDYGSVGSIAIVFRVTRSGEVKSKLIVTKTLSEDEAPDTESEQESGVKAVRYEYDCVKT